jgi:hypothetical protein
MEVTVCIIALVILFGQVHLFKIKTDSNSRYFQLYRLVYDRQNLGEGSKVKMLTQKSLISLVYKSSVKILIEL